LSALEEERQLKFRKFVETQTEQKVNRRISYALERSQLTETGKFIDETEQRMGRRIEIRGQGRPRKGG